MPKPIVENSELAANADVVEQKPASLVVRSSIKEFGHYSIENRALPRVHDGLKPVQRRTLWALYQLKSHSKAVPKKCATVVGKIIGEYHPHGDQAAYEALVNMGWMHYPLVQRHGNFGSDLGLERDPPAAMRYTETRLSAFGDRFFDDIDVVPLIKSFTDEHDEPPILPARVPVMLANGCSGIAMAIATEIPPHNLGELLAACKHLVANPEATDLELCRFVKGPDYGGAILTSTSKEIKAMYLGGEGRMTYRCAYHVEQGTKTSKLVITEKAPGFNVKRLLDETVKLKESKLLINNLNDEGTLKEPTRLTVEFADWTVVRDRILPLLETSVSYRFYALDSANKPRRYNLKTALEDFIELRQQVETAVLRREQTLVREKLGTEKAKLVAIQNIDAVVEIMKAAKTAEEAVTALIETLRIEEWQAQIILGSTIRSLLALNAASVQAKIKEYVSRLKEIKADLKDIGGVIVRRLQEMEVYSTKRGTQLGSQELQIEGLPEKQMSNGSSYIAITPQGRIDRFEEIPLKSKAAWPYVDFIRSAQSLLVVSNANTAQFLNLSYLDRFEPPANSDIIGLAPITPDTKAVVVIASDGTYVAFAPPSKPKPFPVFRGLDSTLLRAVPLRPGDTIAVRFKSGGSDLFTLRDFHIGRPNVKPRYLSGEHKGKEVVEVILKRRSEFLVDGNGNEIGSGSLGKLTKRIFSATTKGALNLVFLRDGKRYLKTSDTLLDYLEKNGKQVAGITAIAPKTRAKKNNGSSGDRSMT